VWSDARTAPSAFPEKTTLTFVSPMAPPLAFALLVLLAVAGVYLGDPPCAPASHRAVLPHLEFRPADRPPVAGLEVEFVYEDREPVDRFDFARGFGGGPSPASSSSTLKLYASNSFATTCCTPTTPNGLRSTSASRIRISTTT